MYLKKSFLAACLFISSATHAAEATKSKDDSFVNPIVIEKMKDMGSYLRSLSKYQIDSQLSRDHVMENGQKIKILGESRLIVDGKDKLYGKLATDDKFREFFYDGKVATIYSPSLNYYTSIEEKGGVSETLRNWQEKYDVDVPMDDLFGFGLDQDVINSLEVAAFVGPSKVNGKVCDHLAFRGPKLDWQLWVSTDKNPLPCKLVITTTDDSSHPEYEATYTWNLNPKIKSADFAFKKKKDDVSIPFNKKNP
ncbi:DUF2092 domain-containing protein [Bdellovibrio sp. HCB288]|uniref:DUF2092 domain-containing protein n=1 Tax=Bdellovibrio sp. HCB288 TaxID=3394355 RepID=UPI0039B37568